MKRCLIHQKVRSGASRAQQLYPDPSDSKGVVTRRTGHCHLGNFDRLGGLLCVLRGRRSRSFVASVMKVLAHLK